MSEQIDMTALDSCTDALCEFTMDVDVVRIGLIQRKVQEIFFGVAPALIFTNMARAGFGQIAVCCY